MTDHETAAGVGEARLVAHPQPGKVWVQIPHRNDIGSDWIAVDELPSLAASTDPAPEGGLRRRILLALAQADGQPWRSVAEATEHTAEIMYGEQADAVEQIIADHKAAFASHPAPETAEHPEGRGVGAVRCDTCSDAGRIPWMIEGDPNCYQERDSDDMIPCPDCAATPDADDASTCDRRGPGGECVRDHEPCPDFPAASTDASGALNPELPIEESA